MTTEKNTNDPWVVKPSDIEKLQKESKGKSSGVFCPKFNATGDRICNACTALYPLGGFPAGSNEFSTYSQKKAKKSWFMNVVLPKDPSKNLILEVGVNIANKILAGASNPDKGWNTIMHPKAGKGLITKVSKVKVPGSEYPQYDVFVDMDRPDWDVPEEVLQNLHNLDRENIIEMIKGGGLTSENYLNISSLELGQTLSFRILPSWNWKSGDTRFANFVARHWGGVTEAEVNGTVKINLNIDAPEKDAEDSLPFTPDKPVQKSGGKNKCFGNETCYDDTSKDCIECVDSKECHKEVLKKSIM